MGLPDHRSRRPRADFIAARETDPLTTSSSCFTFVDDAQARHDEWLAIGVPTDEATGSRPRSADGTAHGLRGFAVVDPSGNLVRVGSPLA